MLSFTTTTWTETLLSPTLITWTITVHIIGTRLSFRAMSLVSEALVKKRNLFHVIPYLVKSTVYGLTNLPMVK